ncbi:MAG: YebC/PmpR family DNA-binding transcriptional regulator, partial [Aquificaceae bacterium]
SEVRHALTKHGGNLGSAGCVSYLFESVGLIEVSKNSIDEDKLYELSIEAGALDFESAEGSFFIYTSPRELYNVKDILEKSVPVEKSELTFRPTTLVQISDEDSAKKILKLLDALDELDDVRQVIANFDIPKEILSKIMD